jgi:ABC-2 type transport system permease protein
MISICKKELSKIFSSLTGYIAIILFMLICGLFLFVLPTSSILENNYATLDKFFELAPWILLFLIPAICMHAISEEYKTGTFELLKTKPITSWQIVKGKYAAILLVTLFVILPTIIYVICIKALSTQGIIDTGGIAGSYVGLFLLAATYAAISLCCSSFTNNAVAAFLLSAAVCLTLYYGFNAISKIAVFANGADFYIEMLGIDFHYKSISRGVIDTRDVVYFLSIILFSLLITVKNISRK